MAFTAPEGFQFVPQAQNAVNAGADPYEVMAHQLKLQGDAAVQAGADPKLINQKRSELLAAAMPAPEQERTVGDKLGAAALGAVTGAAQLGLGAGEIVTGLAGKAGVPGAEKASQYLGEKSVQLEKGLMDVAQEDPTAAKVGQFIGNVAPTMLIPGGTAIKAVAGGAAAGALMEPGDVENRGMARLMGAGMGAAAGGLVTGLGRTAKFLTENPVIQKELSKLPLVGTRGMHKKTGEALMKEVTDVLKSRGVTASGQPIKEANRATWDLLTDKMATKAVTVDQPALNKLNSTITKLADSPLSGDTRTMNALTEIRTAIGQTDNFADMRILKQKINDLRFNEAGLPTKNTLLRKGLDVAEEAVEKSLQKTAVANGSGDLYTMAKNFHQQGLLHDEAMTVLKDSMQGGQITNFKGLLNNINKKLVKTKQVPTAARKEFINDLGVVNKIMQRKDFDIVNEVIRNPAAGPSMTQLLAGTGIGTAFLTTGDIPPGVAEGIGGAVALSLLSRNPAMMRNIAKAYTKSAPKGAQMLRAVLQDHINGEAEAAQAAQQQQEVTGAQ